MKSDSFDSPKESDGHELIPIWKRTLAFAMDMILLIVLLQSIVQILPSAYPQHVKIEFNQLIIDASLLSQDEQSDLRRTTDFLENANLSEETYEMLMTMIFFACLVPPTYFFISELFFNGQTLGKATLRLRTAPVRNDIPLSPLRLFARAVLKGISALSLISPFFIPGLINFVFCFFNRNRRCLHDLAGSSITISSRKNLVKKNES